jgi:glycogen debranching enzyme
MSIAFDRSICRDLNETISREWLVTNGLGGYAAGTIAGVLTRMEQGLLVTSPRDTGTPQLLLAKIDEEIVFDQRTYYLGTNEYRDGTMNPEGFVHLETFRLEEGFPVFTYHLGGIEGSVLEKRIWMQQGQDTTYIQYRLVRTANTDGYAYKNQRTNNWTRGVRGDSDLYATQRELSLTLLPLVAYRPYNEAQHGNNDWHFQVQVYPAQNEEQNRQITQINYEHEGELYLPKGVAGCAIRAWENAPAYSLFVVGQPESQVAFIPTGVWYWNFLRRGDQAAGREAFDDLYLPGVIRARLRPGDDAALTIVVTAEDISALSLRPNSFNLSYKRGVEQQRTLAQPQRYFGEGGETSYELHVLPLSANNDIHHESEEYQRQLLQAGNRFIVYRKPARDVYNPSPFFYEPVGIPAIVTDYYDQANTVRDMLIGLPGLLLATKRYQDAQQILRTLARHFRQGLLPDRLPTSDKALQERDYGNADGALWFFNALDHYMRVTHNYELLDELYQRLVDSIDWHMRGTFNGIQVDSSDGLLRAHSDGKALTWMNALAHGTPVTPRQGKPVEINALWYHALSLMHEWSQWLYMNERITHVPSIYRERASQCQDSFQQRFWNTGSRYLYDVIDGPAGDDASFRPNQLFAISLRYAVLDSGYRRSVFDLASQHLLTPYGLRSLAPQEAGYQGGLPENIKEQQSALHQGSAWPWLLGPYVDAMFSISGSSNMISPRANMGDSNLPEEYLWRKGLQVIAPFIQHETKEMLGMIGGAYDGDAPHRGTYQAASARSVGEILRVYDRLSQQKSKMLPSVSAMRDTTQTSPSYLSIRK